jgi:hypothetical protein
VDTHGDELDPKARRRLKRDFMEMRRDPLAMPVAEFGYTIESMGAGPPPELFDTGLKMAMRVIRDTLGLPEEWDERQFFGAVIGPIANAIEQELKRGLCDLYFASDLVFPEFGFREILKGDPLEVAKLHQTRILSGQETPDEARSDEDRPPIEGGDKLFVPLNVIPIEQTGGVPRETDTAGGLGGSEGRGTLEPGRAPQLSAAFVTSPAGYKAAVQRRYGELRERTLRGQATSCARALRSIVRVEERDVIGALRGSKQLTPEMRHALDMIGKHDPELERVVHQYMLQAGEKGIDAAAALINEQAGDLTSQLDRAFRERAEVAADRFTVVRQERMRAIFEKAVTQSMRPGDVEAAVRKAYSSLNDYFVEGIARDGTAFGYERGAMLTWADSGVRSIDIVFGGGPCGTKVCPDAQSGSPYEIGRDLGHDVGFSYSGAEAPPLHPSCTCFAVASLG